MSTPEEQVFLTCDCGQEHDVSRLEDGDTIRCDRCLSQMELWPSQRVYRRVANTFFERRRRSSFDERVNAMYDAAMRLW